MRLTLHTLSFAHSYRLIIGIILLFLFFRTQKKYPKALNFAFVDLLPQTNNTKLIMRNLLISSMILLSSTYLANPQRINDNEKIQKNWIDIVLSLDISGSMNADDLPPNRLEIAKQVLQKFLQQLETDRIAMVVFAGKPFVSVPLTFDYKIFEDILQRTTTDTINQNVSWFQWTAIGDALLSALTTLEKGRKDIKDNEEREQIIILLTDGAANTGVDPSVAAQLAKEQQVKIYTIWIWSLEWGSIAYQTPFGTKRQAVEWVDETSLQTIAKISWWQYRRATNEQTFQDIIDEISTLEKHDIEIEEVVSYKDTGKGLLFLLGVLSLILWWWERKKPVLPM